MRRSILFLLLGILGACLFTAAISVYVIHDVDQDKIGHWNEAFEGLCAEGAVFALIVVAPTWLLTVLGRRLFRLRNSSSRPVPALLCGIGVTALQYPWEFAGRKLFPKLTNSFLDSYLVVAIVFCTGVLLWDNFKQMKPRDTPEPPSSLI